MERLLQTITLQCSCFAPITHAWPENLLTLLFALITRNGKCVWRVTHIMVAKNCAPPEAVSEINTPFYARKTGHFIDPKPRLNR